MFPLALTLLLLGNPSVARGLYAIHAAVMTFQAATFWHGVDSTKPLCFTQPLDDDLPSGFEGFGTGLPVTPVFRLMGETWSKKSC